MTQPRERLIPFKLRNFLSDKCNQNSEELTTVSKNGLFLKVKPILKQNLLPNIKKFEDLSCEITFTNFLFKLKESSTCKTGKSMEKNS